MPTRPEQPPRTGLATVAGWLGDELLEMRSAAPLTTVTGVTMSAERVVPGDLFVAPAGARAHGAAYAGAALAAGAAAVLTDPAGARMCEPSPVPVLVVPAPRAVVGSVAARIYGNPAGRMVLVGVTGTQGKTTTTRLAEGALTAAGVPAAVVGTVGTRILGTEVKTSLTTPEAPDLHAMFAVMVERGVRVCAVEVSSHALVMGRVDGVVFDVAAFTNLGRDHLDFHTDDEDYFRAKASLFTPRRARLGLVNIDDAHGARLLVESEVATRSFSARRDADWRAVDVRSTATGSSFAVQRRDGTRVETRVPLPGDYNVVNALCAIAALGEAGLDVRSVAGHMASAGSVPGRMERVEAGQDYLAVVDYAHKPDAVAAVLGALRPQTGGRLIVVLGAGGDRDPGKRPLMGATAARLADVVVVTDDNPRSEDPAAIRAAVLAGTAEVAAGRRAEIREEANRRAAIRFAVSAARPGDTVVIAGKGHESGQEVDGEVQPFDDRMVLSEEITAAGARR
jgi:UDP-N-acetylmuramoyl-L-alanyl-D-glutamate--2,6-diaminopimelate ligase